VSQRTCTLVLYKIGSRQTVHSPDFIVKSKISGLQFRRPYSLDYHVWGAMPELTSAIQNRKQSSNCSQSGTAQPRNWISINNAVKEFRKRSDWTGGLYCSWGWTLNILSKYDMNCNVFWCRFYWYIFEMQKKVVATMAFISFRQFKIFGSYFYRYVRLWRVNKSVKFHDEMPSHCRENANKY